MYSFPGSCAASVLISERFIYSQDRSTYFPAAEQVDRSWKYINLSQINECRNWETKQYNSVLGITFSFLGIHKWEPDIYIGFSPARHLQCGGIEPGSGGDQVQGQGDEVGEDSQQVYQVHAALDEPEKQNGRQSKPNRFPFIWCMGFFLTMCTGAVQFVISLKKQSSQLTVYKFYIKSCFCMI